MGPLICVHDVFVLSPNISANQVSKIAKGKLSKMVVFKGRKEKTVGGLTKAHLTKSRRGKIVSKKASAAGKKAYSHISGWTKACQAARKAESLVAPTCILLHLELCRQGTPPRLAGRTFG